MKNIPNCTKCGSEFTYQEGNLFICPECGHEWTEHDNAEDKNLEVVVKDAHGNILKDGDTVTIIKDLKVKGSPNAIKIGLKVKDIRLVPEVNGHNIEARIPGLGTMMLKSEIVKKSN